jgi:N-acetylglutamate synthase
MTSIISGGQALRGMFAVLDLTADLNPGGWRKQGQDGTRLSFSGSALATFNGVFCDGQADAADIKAYAELAGGLPWGVLSRSEPSEELRALAAESGLTGALAVPVMTLPACALDESSEDVDVRRVDSGDRSEYLDALSAYYGGPRDLWSDLMSAAFMDSPATTSYLLEVDGRTVATAFGVLTEGMIGVYCIGTRPEFRRRGYGRAATEAVLRDGFAAGAQGAYLTATDMGFPLYRSIGFQNVETWTHLTQP